MRSPMSAIAASVTPTSRSNYHVDAEIQRVFDAQGVTALKLRTSSVEERITRLKRFKATILANRDAIIEAARLDFQRPAIEVDFTELMPVLMDISDTCRHLRKWLKPKAVRPTAMTFGTKAWIRYEPRGRCLIIAPWNYPLTLTFGPLVPAIAAGNTVIIKTSEVAPNFSRLLAKIVREVFPEDEVAVFEGDATVAKALLERPFDHSFFTGAPAIGKVVMEAASKHLTSVTLELGGKSPTVIDASADLETAVKTIAWGKFINVGQTCIAPDHIYVHESVKDKVITLFKEHLRTLYGEGTEPMNAELGRVINERHTQRIRNLIDDARGRGAKVLHGGIVDVSQHFVAPTLLGDVPAEAKIMEEEIFGPVLPIIGFRDLQEVVDSVNRAPKPLAMYIWTRTEGTAEYLIQRTSAGATCINHVGFHFLHHNLPFGGVNNSGIGSYHGEWGIRAFSHERAVLKTRLLVARMFFPPYRPWLRKTVATMLRYL
jgi:aldehyde dehydrogenase (NAD+)